MMGTRELWLTYSSPIAFHQAAVWFHTPHRVVFLSVVGQFWKPTYPVLKFITWRRAQSPRRKSQEKLVTKSQCKLKPQPRCCTATPSPTKYRPTEHLSAGNIWALGSPSSQRLSWNSLSKPRKKIHILTVIGLTPVTQARVYILKQFCRGFSGGWEWRRFSSVVSFNMGAQGKQWSLRSSDNGLYLPMAMWTQKKIMLSLGVFFF